VASLRQGAVALKRQGMVIDILRNPPHAIGWQ
jgi:hypothetical protein